VHHVGGNEAFRILFGKEGGGEHPRQEARILHQRRLERNVGIDAANHESVQRVAHPATAWSRVAPWQISLAIIES
jgi:hypothetical protein